MKTIFAILLVAFALSAMLVFYPDTTVEATCPGGTILRCRSICKSMGKQLKRCHKGECRCTAK
uniref:CSab-Lyc-15 n=1 Tax=Lychas buchari TaxID=1330406 RepID=T1E7P1_9SCOR